MTEELQLHNKTMQNGSADQPTLLWKHADPQSTKMYEFLQLVNKKYSLKLRTYDDLYGWSINNIANFWEEVWIFTGMVAETGFQKVVSS
jgi:acetoacetyl-CoA synthetase